MTDKNGMRWIEGGAFQMGSVNFYPEEAPVRTVRVDGFWIDETPVTNREFAAFVDATGYRSFAEIPPDPRDYPGMDPALAVAGSLLFQRTAGPVDLGDYSQWWTFSTGTDWRHPHGPDSSIAGLEDHPVVHVAYQDVEAYAKWAGKTLPTEAEWEFAARGGMDGADYAWGDELAPGGAMLANYWQGAFPYGNTLEDGYERTSPVGSYPANGYGLFDMIGNVWELTASAFTDEGHCGCGTGGGPVAAKGGSFLCAGEYCARYRPAARIGIARDASSSNVGFRCAA